MWCWPVIRYVSYLPIVVARQASRSTTRARRGTIDCICCEVCVLHATPTGRGCRGQPPGMHQGIDVSVRWADILGSSRENNSVCNVEGR